MSLGIALGGGGAKGFAHIGVLEALQEEGIEFDVITGCSIGAIVGAVYAAGNLELLKSTSTQIKITEIPKLLSPAFPRSGLFSGKNAIEMLMDLVKKENIEDLDKTFGSVSACINTGELRSFTKGEVRKALKASFAIPGLFTPEKDGDSILVDGGTIEPIPMELARDLGADTVIAVDLFGNPALTPIEGSENFLTSAIQYFKSASEKISWLNSNSPNLIDILEQTLVISQMRLTSLRLKESPPNVVIQPAVREVGILDFHRGEPIIELGRQAAKEKMAEIKELIN